MLAPFLLLACPTHHPNNRMLWRKLYPLWHMLTSKSPVRRTLSSREAYAQWAERYPPVAHNTFMQLEEVTLRGILPDLTDKIVLDLACGTGRWGKIAQHTGARWVLGIDNSPEMLQNAVLQARVQADLTAIPLADAMVDVVVCGLAVGHIPPDAMRQAVREMGRVVRRGGHVLISDLHPIQAWRGGQRTFTNAQGQVYAVEHYPHSIAAYHAAARDAGLTLVTLRETQLQPSTPPVVLVLHFVKS